MSRPAIYRGIAELQSKGGEKFWPEPGRIRRARGRTKAAGGGGSEDRTDDLDFLLFAVGLKTAA